MQVSGTLTPLSIIAPLTPAGGEKPAYERTVQNGQARRSNAEQRDQRPREQENAVLRGEWIQGNRAAPTTVYHPDQRSSSSTSTGGFSNHSFLPSNYSSRKAIQSYITQEDAGYVQIQQSSSIVDTYV